MEEQPRKRSNAFFIVIGIVLILCCCICSVAGFFLWQTGAITTSLTFTNPPQEVAPPTPSTIPSATANPSKPMATDTKAYTNSEFNFSFDYPKDWRLEEKTSTGPYVQIFSAQENSSDTFLENLNVIVYENPYSNLDEFVSVTSENTKLLYPDYNLVSTTNVSIGGRDARKMVSSATVNGVKIKQFQIYLNYGDLGYSFIYSGVGEGFAKFEGKVLDVISSVSFN
jgi:hypothetical protein